MSEKTYVFTPEGGGTDPMVAAMMNGGMGGAMWNNPIWALVFLAFLRNGGILGNGNCGTQADTVFVSSQLGQAIAGNANAISNLSTHLDCSIGQIQNGLNALQSGICNVANQTGMSALQIINAIQSGNNTLASQLAACCCDLKTATERGFSNLAYENASQTCAVKQAIADNTAAVIAKLDSIEDSRKDREISNLTAALTAANSRAERQAELAPIYKALSDIECKQPQTTTIPYSPVTAVPNCVAYGLGLGVNPFGINNGSIWG